MTRKDYVLIAGALRKARERYPTPANTAHLCVADCIADALVGDNPRFDRDRFVEACMLGEGALPPFALTPDV